MNAAVIQPNELNSLICAPCICITLRDSRRLLIKQIPLISSTCKQHQHTVHSHFCAIFIFFYKSSSENVFQRSLNNKYVMLRKESNFSWLLFVYVALRSISLNRQVIIFWNYVFGTLWAHAVREMKLAENKK